jgi:hypothetical protein
MKISFENNLFIASSEDVTISSETATGLAQKLIDQGILPEDVTWDVWTLENKFRDIMKAVLTKQPTWARMAEFELKMRMTT